MKTENFDFNIIDGAAGTSTFNVEGDSVVIRIKCKSDEAAYKMLDLFRKHFDVFDVMTLRFPREKQ